MKQLHQPPIETLCQSQPPPSPSPSFSFLLWNSIDAPLKTFILHSDDECLELALTSALLDITEAAVKEQGPKFILLLSPLLSSTARSE